MQDRFAHPAAQVMSRAPEHRRRLWTSVIAAASVWLLALPATQATIVYNVDQPLTTQPMTWTHAVAETGDYQLGAAWIEVTVGDVSVEVRLNGALVKKVCAAAGEVIRFETWLEDLGVGDEVTVSATPQRGSYALGCQLAFATPTFDGLPIFDVATYGAVGDGTTDDWQAIRDAVNAAVNAGGGIVQFDGAKTYRAVGDTTERDRVLPLENAQNVKIDGRGAKILIHPPHRLANIDQSENIQIDDLVVDYAPLPYFQGDILSADTSNWTVDIQVPTRYDLPEVGVGGWVFGRTFLPETPGSRSGHGQHLYISEVETIDRSGRMLRVHADIATGGNKTKQAVQSAASGEATELVVPARNVGHYGNWCTQTQRSARVLFSNLRFYRVIQQGMLPEKNVGPVTYRNVDIKMPDASEDPVFNRTAELFVSWRGHYLTGNNRFGVRIEDGDYDAGAMYDDLYNGHTDPGRIVAIGGGAVTLEATVARKLKANFWQVGDWVSVWEGVEVSQRGMARLTSVAADGTETILTFDRPIPGVAIDDTVLNEDLMNRGTMIRNCRTTDIGAGYGSLRLRTPLLIQNCELDNIYFWAHLTDYVEGPRTRDAVLCDTYIRGGWPDRLLEPIDVTYSHSLTLRDCTIDGGRIDCSSNTEGVVLDSVSFINMPGDILYSRNGSSAAVLGGTTRNGVSHGLANWVAVDGSSNVFWSAAPVWQAEDATISGGAIQSDGADWNGTGYVNLNEGGYVEWTVDVPCAGAYDLRFTVAGAADGMAAEIRVNGVAVNSALPCPNVGSWNDNWQTAVEPDVALNAGANTVRLRDNGANQPQIDQLEASPHSAVPGDCDGDGYISAVPDGVSTLDCLGGPAAVPGCTCSDADGDGDVDLADYWKIQAAAGDAPPC